MENNSNLFVNSYCACQFCILFCKHTKELTYSQVVNLFKTDQVTEYNLDLTSGSLTYKTKDKPDETQKYSVPSVTYFVDDIRDSVNEYNDENPDNQISYNYTASSSKSWILSLLPTLLLVVIISILSYYFIKKM